MASAAEQLAASFNFSALGKAEDLKKRIWFTLGALIVYRLGTYIPIPGIDAAELARFAAQNSSGILGLGQRSGRRRAWPHGDLCAQHHAVYFGLDHHPAPDRGLAAS